MILPAISSYLVAQISVLIYIHENCWKNLLNQKFCIFQGILSYFVTQIFHSYIFTKIFEKFMKTI